MKKALSLCLLLVMVLLISSCSKGKVENSNDFLTNSVWEFSNDQSQIHFNEDDKFIYYRDADDTTNYYYTGTYELYRGKEATSYITENLKDYGITKSELARIFLQEGDSEDGIVCLVLNNEEQIIDNENMIKETFITPYFGYYFNNSTEEFIGLINMNTASDTGITKLR
ncbi:hypothetical protein LJB88_04015 [Erysipelotrichaceae bacterium OttesenSCG-928-M19]|nr:hypothetical protein [Erysipelotrichaceae bacterium OttesenSCG-928-M19]